MQTSPTPKEDSLGHLLEMLMPPWQRYRSLVCESNGRMMATLLGVSTRTSGSLNKVCIGSGRYWMWVEGKPTEQPAYENRYGDEGAAIHPAG